MPYIDKDLRLAVDPCGGDHPHGNAIRPGTLNFQLTRIVQAFLGTEPDYQKFNDAVGALECCKLELYRRMVAPYEEKKIIDNGDVY
jgi:hypothetical protein